MHLFEQIKLFAKVLKQHKGLQIWLVSRFLKLA